MIARDVLLVFDQIGDVRNNNIHAQQLGFRKHQAGVDDNNVVFPAEGEAVHAELAQSAEGDNFQFFA